MIGAAFDTETTGLLKHPRAKPHLQPKMIEFGCILFDEDGEIDRLGIILDPGEEIEEIITKITGLTNDDLRGQRKFPEAFAEISAFIERADALFAHNLAFDTEILNLELDRMGVQRWAFPWPKIRRCTVEWYKRNYGRRVKLTKLYEDRIGKPLAQTHRAVDDCEALMEVILRDDLLRKLSPTSR